MWVLVDTKLEKISKVLLTLPSSCKTMFILYVVECLANQFAQNFMSFGEPFVATHPLEITKGNINYRS